MTCHQPHGSPNRSLMTRPDRALCITCHTDRMTHGGGRSCFSAMGCHNEIHGSNKNRLMIGAATFGPTDTGLGRPGLLE
jgi:predicted CXXCH cytochrome family protein